MWIKLFVKKKVLFEIFNIRVFIGKKEKIKK